MSNGSLESFYDPKSGAGGGGDESCAALIDRSERLLPWFKSQRAFHEINGCI
jgi:hypothetical protein